jgi:hypothetical protein
MKNKNGKEERRKGMRVKLDRGWQVLICKWALETEYVKTKRPKEIFEGRNGL